MSTTLHAIHIVFVALYMSMLAILTVYGIHRYSQIFLYFKNRRKSHKPAGKFAQLPTVTIQLPMFNEQFVAERVIEATCKIDYPAHLLQIQILDDSTNECADIARAVCERMRRLGHNIHYIHRTNRAGYKAGAMENGLKTATGDYIAIFDADFVPTPDMVRRCIDFFTDPAIGCVQSRWGHMNRDASFLTQCQAIFLDGHFMVEHIARNRSGRFINFNGTGGIWSRKAIADAGGWQDDTLNEDIDLSYRAQLRGWKFVFLPELISPAELPGDTTSFKQQQRRWTKGLVQTAKKLLPSVLAAPVPWWVKVEGFFHMTSGVVYLPAVILSVLLFPTFYMPTTLWESTNLVIAVAVTSFCGLLTCSAGTFYVVSQQAVGRSGFKTTLMIPFLMALGVGLSFSNALGAMEGFFGGKKTKWDCTPKFGTAGGSTDPQAWTKRTAAPRRKVGWLPFLEIGLGFYLAGCTAASLVTKQAIGTIPFLLIFMVGYLYVGVATLHNRWASTHARVRTAAGDVRPQAESVAA